MVDSKRAPWGLALVLLGSLAIGANAKTPQQLVAEFADILPAGMKARAAWAFGGTIYCVDSDSGTIRELTPASIFPGGARSLDNPNVTRDGSRVIFKDVASGQLFVINWNGAGLRCFMPFGSSYQYYSRCWTDKSTNTDWAVWHRDGINRTNVDKPAQNVLLWNKTGVIYPGWFSLSEDGTHVGMERDSQIVGVGVVPNGAFARGDTIGCRVSIAADNSYDFMCQAPYHKLLRICDSSGVKKQDFAFTDTIITWSKANGFFVYDLLEFDMTKWLNNRDYIIFFMNCTSVNPFVMRLSDRKFMYLQAGLHSLGPADMAIFPKGPPASARPVISTVDDFICQAARPVSLVVRVRGVPAPAVTAAGLPRGVSLVNTTADGDSVVIAGASPDTGRSKVILTATNSMGVDRDTFNFTVRNSSDTPSVYAGRDTTTRLGHTFSLSGIAADKGTVVSLLQIAWKLISGPDSGAVIANPSTLTTSVTFTAVGDYQFQLKATDGKLAGFDTVNVKVLDVLPFVVLSPSSAQRIPIGGVDTVRWQIDPPTEVIIELSTDTGYTYQGLTVASVAAGQTWWAWSVSDALPVSDSCILSVRTYSPPFKYAYSGVFSLVDRTAARSRMKVASVKSPDVKHYEYFSLDGRRLGLSSRTFRREKSGQVQMVAICRARGELIGARRVVLVP